MQSFVVLRSILWNYSGWWKQKTRPKQSFYSLLLNSKRDDVLIQVTILYKEWWEFYREPQVLSSQFCFFLFFFNYPLLKVNEEIIWREIYIVFSHLIFKYTWPQPGSNPTNNLKDMIQIHSVSLYFENPSNSFYMSFFSSTADDPVAWRRVTAIQSDFPNFTDILKTSDDAKKKII